MITVKIDTSATDRLINDLQRSIVPKAINAALNRVVVTGRSEAVRTIARTTGLKQKDIREHLDIRRAGRGDPAAEIRAKPWSPNLIRYQARQTQAGVSAKAWGQRKVYKGSFIGNKGRTVFTRTGKARLPLKALHGPSVPREFMRDVSLQALEVVAKQRFPIEFERALAQFMRTRR